MGGLQICAAIILPTLMWANLNTAAVWVALTSVVLYGAIGLWDDYTKVTRKRNLGLTVRQKFGLEILAAVVIGLLLLWMNSKGAYSTELNVPFFKNFKPDPVIHSLLQAPWSYALAFIPFFAVVVLVLAGSSEGVNLADGLDGLAIGLMLIVGMAMTALAFVSGNAELEPVSGDFAHAWSVGVDHLLRGAYRASLGFLWYNAHPAEIFMGDVGSLALGGAMGTVSAAAEAGAAVAADRWRFRC